ncbi:MAG: hypothetical protein MJZ36_00315 [Bacteroidaceae bacterium]|nr:hypothetical protein [Bacteroidaceae bacterium]
MTELETVFQNLKAFRYKPWDEARLDECKTLVRSMGKEDLRKIIRSRWMDKSNALYPTLFELYYHDELADVVDKLKDSETKDLVTELKSTHSSFKKEKIRDILLERYEEMSEEERKSVFKKLLG